MVSSGTNKVDTIPSLGDIKKIDQKFWEIFRGYLAVDNRVNWAADKALEKLRFEAGLLWVSSNEGVSIPNKNGKGDEWRIVDDEQFCFWKLEHF